MNQKIMKIPLREYQVEHGPWIKTGQLYRLKLSQSAALSVALWHTVDHQKTLNTFKNPEQDPCFYTDVDNLTKNFADVPSHMQEHEYTDSLVNIAKVHFSFIEQLSFVSRVERMHFGTIPAEDEVYIDPGSEEIDADTLLRGVGLMARVGNNGSCFLSGNELNESRETAWLRIPIMEVEDIPIKINKDVVGKIPSQEACWITGLNIDSLRRSPKGIVVSAIPIHSSYEGVVNFAKTNEDRSFLPNGSIFRPTFWPFR